MDGWMAEQELEHHSWPGIANRSTLDLVCLIRGENQPKERETSTTSRMTWKRLNKDDQYTTTLSAWAHATALLYPCRNDPLGISLACMT
jgi:hypothetical protein